ncbi:MAG: hypothetical protein KFW09_02885 [Oscillospiraceae bacterium]|nr:hypothetical protein [Oscillospiraceae bacterium]
MKKMLNFFGNIKAVSQNLSDDKTNIIATNEKEISYINNLEKKDATNVVENSIIIDNSDKKNNLNTKNMTHDKKNIIKEDSVLNREEDINALPLIRKILVTNSPNSYAKQYLKNNNLRDEYISICSRIGTLKLKKNKVASSGCFRTKGASTLEIEILSLEKRKNKLSAKLEDLYKLTSRTSKYTKVVSSKIIDS